MADILRALFRNAAANGSKTAFTDEESSLTWSQLASRVSAFSEHLRAAAPVVGLYGGNEVEWVIALLAGWMAGKTLVPLPTFFSTTQLRHVFENAGVGDIVSTGAEQANIASLGGRIFRVSRRRRNRFSDPVAGGGLIIYTSGSTGRPKGVQIGLEQVDWQARALSRLSGANSLDLHLSILPLSLLLEIVCAIGVSTLAGARTHLATGVARATGNGRLHSLDIPFRQTKATTSVLIPQLLTAWVAELETTGRQAPEGLRFVALGGAPISETLSDRAWKSGIPVHEGYGLSECCSVVSVNPPQRRKAGTVGRPLPGLDVRIDDGEIVVSGPTVMKGYLNGAEVGTCWRTGDLGHLDEDGYLTVSGRKDNLLVTSFGRNVHPEWIEAMLVADARIRACVVFGHGEQRLRVLLIPSAAGEEWLARSARTHILLWIEQMCVNAPQHAVPKDFVSCTAAEAVERGLLSASGNPVRSAAPATYHALRRNNVQGDGLVEIVPASRSRKENCHAVL